MLVYTFTNFMERGPETPIDAQLMKNFCLIWKPNCHYPARDNRHPGLTESYLQLDKSSTYLHTIYLEPL